MHAEKELLQLESGDNAQFVFQLAPLNALWVLRCREGSVALGEPLLTEGAQLGGWCNACGQRNLGGDAVRLEQRDPALLSDLCCQRQRGAPPWEVAKEPLHR